VSWKDTPGILRYNALASETNWVAVLPNACCRDTHQLAFLTWLHGPVMFPRLLWDRQDGDVLSTCHKSIAAECKRPYKVQCGGEYGACRWTEDFLLTRDKRGVVIHSLTANIRQFKHCNSLVHFFLWRANVFTLDSNVRTLFPLAEPCIAVRLASLAGINLWSVEHKQRIIMQRRTRRQA
jgi:hypothetical protein